MKTLKLQVIILLMLLSVKIYSQTTPAQNFNKGLEMYYGAKYQEAVKFFDEYIKSEPNQFKGYNYRGLSYQGMKNYPKALEDFTKAISVEPSNSEGYLNRGYTHLYQQKFSPALTDFSDAIRIDAHNIDAYIGKSMVYIIQRKYSEAMTNLNSASGVEPKSARIFITKAWVYILTDDTAKVIYNVSMAMYFDSNVVFTEHKRELLGFKLDNYRKALSIADQRIDKNPENYMSYFNRGIIYFFMNNYEKASADLKKSKSLNKNYNAKLDVLIDQIFRSIKRNS